MTFLPRLKTVGPEDFGAVPALDTSFERLEKRNVSSDSIYTSGHGIRVDLTDTCADELIRSSNQQAKEYDT